MIPFETMGPCKKCGDYLKPCRCELIAKTELMERMAAALELAIQTSKTGMVKSEVEVLNKALQEYRERKDAK